MICQPSFDHRLTLTVYLTASVWVNQYQRNWEFGSIYSPKFYDAFHVSKITIKTSYYYICSKSLITLYSTQRTFILPKLPENTARVRDSGGWLTETGDVLMRCAWTSASQGATMFFRIYRLKTVFTSWLFSLNCFFRPTNFALCIKLAVDAIIGSCAFLQNLTFEGKRRASGWRRDFSNADRIVNQAYDDAYSGMGVGLFVCLLAPCGSLLPGAWCVALPYWPEGEDHWKWGF